jgi:hypothetical protein
VFGTDLCSNDDISIRVDTPDAGGSHAQYSNRGALWTEQADYFLTRQNNLFIAKNLIRGRGSVCRDVTDKKGSLSHQ